LLESRKSFLWPTIAIAIAIATADNRNKTKPIEIYVRVRACSNLGWIRYCLEKLFILIEIIKQPII
jgi:hypothetical protein